MNFESIQKKIDELKVLTLPQMQELAKDIRSVILDTVSKNGGHLAANLGMVEATIVLHKIFDSPNDKIIFDVGHQCYAHKILSGRLEEFSTLRTYGGISGFTNRFESEHDVLYEGHCGTSISAALGIAEANRLKGNDNYAVAIVGDGALTNGMIYEALNNCAEKKLNLIILINDNEMSISKNVGGLHNYLSRIRTSKGYFTFKRKFESILDRIPIIGYKLAKLFKNIKDFFKRWVIKDNFFEDMGLVYLGPVDGHNMERLTEVLEEAKLKHIPCVVHMRTQKGKGYRLAEESPDQYHAVSAFDLDSGVTVSNELTFSTFIGNEMCRLASEDEHICAITAAMTDGTGLTRFSREFEARFFDVGISEEHAITFASGLAVNGMKPVVMLYSTFAQRSFDQIFHDLAIQKLPMVLALDRCGIVPGDGITHQGIFDYALFSILPNVCIYSPESYADVRNALEASLDSDTLSIIRYPKGVENVEYEKSESFITSENNYFAHTEKIEDAEIVIVSYGRLSYQGYLAYKSLCEKHSVGLVKLKLIYPLDKFDIVKLCPNAKLIYVIDEGISNGGFAEKLTAVLIEGGYKNHIASTSIYDYIEHGDLDTLMHECGFTAEQIVSEIKSLADELGI